MFLLLLSVIYLAFISLGLPDSLLGSAWPTMRVQFNVPISFMGILSIIISLGTVVSGLFSERLSKMFGAKWVTIFSVILTAVAMFGFSISDEFFKLCIWGIPFGLGAGAIDAVLNNYVAQHYNSRHMNWLHCFWGVGTIISPYIMSYALTHSAWTDGFKIVSYIQFGIAGILILTIPLWAVNKKKEDEIASTKVLGIKGALKIKGVTYMLIGFFAYCALESTAMLWTSSYFEGVFNSSKEESALLGALCYLGITVGRFVSGFVSVKLGDNLLIKIGSAILFVGIIAIAVPVKIVAIIGFIIIGFGCAPIYPCIIHSAPDNFGKENSQGVIGIQMAAAYLGFTFMPPLFGLIANHIDLRLLPIFLVLCFILMIIFVITSINTCKKINTLKNK